MPRIPLYNQGQGSAVRLEAGQLSRRADVGAFTAPGRAAASFASAAGNIAYQFGQAEKRAEEERVYTESLAALDKDFDLFKRTPIPGASDTAMGEADFISGRSLSIESYNNAADTFKQGFLGRIDNMPLTRGQKRSIKNRLSKSVDSKIAGFRSTKFTEYQTERKRVFSKGLDAISNDISAASDEDREELYAEAEALINFAKTNGFDTGYTISGMRFDVDRKDHLKDRENESLGIEYFQQQLQDVNNAEGKYSGYSTEQQTQMASFIESQINYLETGVVAEANELARNALDSITLTGDDGGLGNRAINKYRQAGRLAEANKLELAIDVNEDAYSQVYSNPFSTKSADIEIVKAAERKARETAVREPEKTSRAKQTFEAIATAVAAKQEQIQKDPASYVQQAFRRKHGFEPTKSQILQKQIDMGLRTDEIKVLTSSEATTFIDTINAANTPLDVTAAFAGIGIGAGADKKVSALIQPYMMRQLKASGMSLAQNYVANSPMRPLAGKLLLSAQPDAMKIQVTPAARTKVRSAVIKNETFSNHIKSMLGGSYADFSNNQIVGAASSTRLLNSARDEHVKMIEDLTLFLAQEKGLVLSGDEGVRGAALDKIVSEAVTILDERYSYIDNFKNSEVTLRIPKHLSASAPNIKAAIDAEMSVLTSDDIFYESGRFEEGTVEHALEKEAYTDTARLSYGAVASQDGKTALVVNADGGLIFVKDEQGNPVPKSINIEEASSYEIPPAEETVSQNMLLLQSQREEIMRELRAIGQETRTEETRERAFQLQAKLKTLNEQMRLESRVLSGSFTRVGLEQD